LLELDLQAALAAKPELIVVDELAHTNAIDDEQPLVHAKRWQDIEALLGSGIDVFTTVNVQHLESLNDVVAKITGVIVRETVPDSVFEQADEVELVDFPPDDLIERLREGKVYVSGQAARALEHFFNKGNLIALRELALRKMAERVDRQMTDYRADQAIDKTWPAAERLLVCVTPGPTSPSLVRATRRMAASLRAPWIAVHVETPSDARPRPADQERLAETLQLVRRLGGEVVTLGGADPTGEIVAYARQRNVTKIIVGKTLRSRLREFFRGSFVNELSRRCGDIDVYIISGVATGGPGPAAAGEHAWQLKGYAAALAAIAVSSALCFLLFPFVSTVTLCMIYLAGVVAVAAWHGRGPSILASFLAVLAFDYFFIDPRYSFAVGDTQYVFTFAVMLLTGLLISTLTGRLTFQASLARRREQQAAELSELSRALVEIDELPHLVRVGDQLERLVGGSVYPLVAARSTEAGQPQLTPISVSPGELNAHEQAVANWVAEHSAIAGLGTDTLPSVGLLFVPLVAAGDLVGVLGVRPNQGITSFAPDQLRLIETVAGQLALVVERIQSADLAHDNQLRYEREKLRSALLSAVSHDLRTPLAAIAGAGSTLAEAAEDLHPATRRELAESIVAETDRLNRLVANLLDMTRLDAGSLQLDRDWHPLEDLTGGVLHRLRRLLANQEIAVEISPAVGLIYVDELLMHQVLTNLVENALRFAPPGSQISIKAGALNQKLWLEVADQGPGITPGDEERIFEKFYRAPNQQPRSGTGLGLAICRGIVELHGGRIRAMNRSEGGASFRIDLPQPPQPALPMEVAIEERALRDAAK
jgi:two-component system sensor histidine kinase KdpD